MESFSISVIIIFMINERRRIYFSILQRNKLPGIFLPYVKCMVYDPYPGIYYYLIVGINRRWAFPYRYINRPSRIVVGDMLARGKDER